ncbi:MAG TPA: glycosyltransferase family protein [Arachidicoccus soli]|nr:glycosyltransferase family protein [Arachidicoccus soli]
MKILYAIQATGNGHISRAMELLPHIEKYGTVDLFLSGSNSTLALNTSVAFRSKGLSLKYTCDGKLHYGKTFTAFSWRRLHREAKDLPIEKYDLILNDFDAITSLACKIKKVPSIHFGHQASFVSEKTPRPEHTSFIGEWILRNYAKGTQNLGLHFDKYDDFIQTPVIKTEIWNANAKNKNYITVYLPSYCDKELIDIFSKIKGSSFQIFSRQIKKIHQENNNLTLYPVDKHLFNTSLINSNGIITGAGFETPAEAMYLQKKIMAIPIGGQYEQICNAAALKNLGVFTLPKIENNFKEEVQRWLQEPHKEHNIDFKPTSFIVEKLMEVADCQKLKQIDEIAVNEIERLVID